MVSSTLVLLHQQRIFVTSATKDDVKEAVRTAKATLESAFTSAYFLKKQV